VSSAALTARRFHGIQHQLLASIFRSTQNHSRPHLEIGVAPSVLLAIAALLHPLAVSTCSPWLDHSAPRLHGYFAGPVLLNLQLLRAAVFDGFMLDIVFAASFSVLSLDLFLAPAALIQVQFTC
jgi:hypothetical protein